MATFVTTIKFTPQGLANIQDTVKRASAFKATAKKMGVKIDEILWMLGRFDGLILFEAPDDETATALMLRLAALGNVHTQTTRAFRTSEIEQVLAALGK